MKKFFRFLLSLVFVLFSCKSRSVPVTKITRNESENLNFRQINDEKTSDLQIYFPLFTDSNGEFVEGDGIVIIFPNKQVMVVDGFHSSAAKKLITFLKDDLNITTIDYLISSHFHADHIGTFCDIIDSFCVKTFYSNGAPINTSPCAELLKKVEESKIPHVILKEGDLLQIDEIKLHVLAPNLSQDDLYKIYYEPGKTAKRINLSSIVMKLSYNYFSILFTGDVYKKGEEELVKKYSDILKSTVLKVPHHGDYYTSNKKSFLQTVNPEFAIGQNPMDFKPITKLRYKSLNIPLLRAEKSGYLLINTDGHEYFLNCFVDE